MKLPHSQTPPRPRPFRPAGLIAALAVVSSFAANAQDAAPSAEAKPASVRQAQASAPDRHTATIRGRLEGFRHVRLPSGDDQQQDEQTLVSVRLQDGRKVTIALGPRTDLDALGLQRNDFIAVQGRAEIVEGVPALVADRIDVNGQRVSVRQGDARARQVNGRPEQQRAPGKKPSVIEADARPLLDQVRAAYQSLESLETSGTVATHIEAADTVLKTNLGFTSSYQSPNKFRHDTTDMLIGSTGEQAFVFNKKTNNYVQQAVAANQAFSETFPATALTVLHAQNPSLLAAMLRAPFQRVLEAAERVEKIDDAVVDGKSYPQLVLRGVEGHGPISVLIDPQTHLVRRVTADLRRSIESPSERKGVRQADVVVDYTVIQTQPKFADDHFAWQTPAGASDVAQQRASEEQSARGLVGKEAPNFQLTALDGRKVALADLRGKVVVLDFWASWCPPCQKTLPHLGRIYQDKMGDGVEFYAINVGEEKDRIQTFVRMNGLGVPVLLDPQGETAKKYGVRGIPKTVVIGKDGKVTEVFTGLSGDTYRKIRDAIAQANGTRAAEPKTSAPEKSERPASAS